VKVFRVFLIQLIVFCLPSGHPSWAVTSAEEWTQYYMP
jgi:hypothetical protein